MKYDAHEYQRFAQDFIEDNPVAAVFLDCGLGKTVITLSAIRSLMHDRFEVSRVLVIAPLRVARDTWPAEIAKWDHLAGLTCSVAVGTERERLAAVRQESDICVINRENVSWLIERSGLPFGFDMIVIDELSSFKSRQSQRFRALMKARPRASRIVGLTGTPASNGLMDLWAEFRVLDMGRRLGRFISGYRDEFFVPDRRNAQVVFSYRPKPGAEDGIYRRIGDITISMRASDHLDMPELVESDVTVRLSEPERRLYERLRDELALSLEDGEVTAANAASLAGKLCQMANGAVYTDGGIAMPVHDRKLDALEDIIEAANGNPVLVAYWFRHDRERIEARLRKLKIPFSALDSSRSIRDWNAGLTMTGLINPASAGHGLNLQAGGSHLVWFGLSWSLELYQQTVARLWRQGQESRTVVVQRIVAERTMDARILEAIGQKGRTQDALLDAVKAEMGGRR